MKEDAMDYPSGDDLNRRTILAHAAGLGMLASIAPSGADAAITVLHKPIAWNDVRAEFPLRNGLVHLNSANLGPTWLAATAEMESISRSICADPSFENRFAVGAGVEATRTAVARMLNAVPDEIALVRNASEANCTVINGLELGPGDEVVLWDQNHESNDLAWAVAARRRGFKVLRISTPVDPKHRSDMLRPFLQAFSPRTKIVAFSHVSNSSGLAIAADELCSEARSRGILSLIDGAQTFGAMQVDLRALDCDFYSASAHKWLCGPHETGIFAIRASAIEKLWPSIVTHGWDGSAQAGARKFDRLGQRHDGRIEGLGVAVGKHQSIGAAAIEDRIRYLVRELRQRLAATGKPVRFITPEHESLSAGIVSFTLNGPAPRALMQHFYTKYSVSTRVSPDGDLCSIRLCPNIYTTLDDLDVAVRAIATMP